jgi:hypothetical protein
MLIKKRKRKITLGLEFTIVAKDGPSVATIEQKAGQNKIEVFRKGHAKNRLYFRCMPETKDLFLKDISNLCFGESIVIPPNSIRKHIRKNLVKAATNKLDKVAARAALKILTGESADRNKLATLTHAESEPAKISSCNNSAASIKPTPKPTILKLVIQGLKNFISRVRFFIKPKRLLASIQR